MQKLNLNQLKNLASTSTENYLLERIFGGDSNDCHDAPPLPSSCAKGCKCARGRARVN